MNTRITRKEAAAILNVTVQNIRKLVLKGVLDETREGITIASVENRKRNKPPVGRPAGSFKTK